jgi:hypothetical protein
MMFRNYCYEKWQQYQEETCEFMRGKGYNHECLEYPEYIAKHKWWLRRLYRAEYKTLQKKWVSDHVRSLSSNL